MDKVVCDICGTSYPDSAQCCPICGSSREYALEVPQPTGGGMPEYIPAGRKSGGRFSSSNKKSGTHLYDFDAPESDVPQDIFPEEGPSFENDGHPRHNYFAVIGFTILIFCFLLATAFLFFRYYLPGTNPQVIASETEPSLETESSETQTEPDPEIPCENLVLTTGVPEINRIGQYWLLHVIVSPEDTTDQLTFVSSDENVVTVTPEGRLCAVGEGQTIVLITCGDKQIQCSVTVREDDTEALADQEEILSSEPSEATEPEMQTEEVTEPDEEEATEPSATEETEPEQTVEETEPEETTKPGEIILRLKQEDLTFKKKGVTYQLELDCDLDPADVKWITLDPTVAICHDGLITVVGKGTTKIVASYGDQEVYCIIRVDLS